MTAINTDTSNEILLSYFAPLDFSFQYSVNRHQGQGDKISV